jgi:hypothetical protein
MDKPQSGQLVPPKYEAFDHDVWCTILPSAFERLLTLSHTLYMFSCNNSSKLFSTRYQTSVKLFAHPLLYYAQTK